MKTPVVWVTTALAAAIVLTASFLIDTGTRGDNAPLASMERVLRMAPGK
jgi:hypothetical protein